MKVAQQLRDQLGVPSEPPQRSGAQPYPLDTDTFGARNHVKGQSVRARLCRTGSYFGVIPIRLASGRLAWPDVQVVAEEQAA